MAELSPLKHIQIASRGSMLAMWQARYIQSLLKNHGLTSDICEIKTTGDRVQNRFLHEIGGKGLFIKELEQSLLKKKTHLAIHSMKDLPAALPQGFKVAAVLKRHAPTDILIFKPEAEKKLNLPKGMLTKEDMQKLGRIKIATGSLRRISLLKEASSNIESIPIRGNVNTRIDKLMSSDWDGLILAEASLDRLDMKKDLVTRRLDPNWFTPSAAQGALAIETLEDDPLQGWLDNLGCNETMRLVNIEREILKNLGGDCTMPFGCYARNIDNKTHIDAVILDRDGKSLRRSLVIDINEPVKNTAEKVTAELFKNGALEFLKRLEIHNPPYTLKV